MTQTGVGETKTGPGFVAVTASTYRRADGCFRLNGALFIVHLDEEPAHLTASVVRSSFYMRRVRSRPISEAAD